MGRRFGSVRFFFLLLSLTISSIGEAQQDSTAFKKKESRFKQTFSDSLDNKFDVSRWLSSVTGFLPVPILITEPAVGYGIMMNVAFFHTTKRSMNRGTEKKRLSLPSMTIAGGAYTQNGTWAAFAGHYGSYRQDRLRVALFSGYMNIFLDYYFTGMEGNERSATFKFKGVPLYTSLGHRIGASRIYFGLDYFFLKTDIELETDIEDPEFNRFTGESRVGGMGAKLTYEGLDNNFTPNNGMKINLRFTHFGPNIGSDNMYEMAKGSFLGFTNKVNKLVMGLRFQADLTIKDPPFYMRPFVNLRGIPLMRYQGDYVLTLETEERFNISRRWALVGFVGVGIPTDYDHPFTMANAKYAGGGGFRYLMARWFGMYMGVDVAAGTDSWAWYIIMGSYWLGK